MCLTNAGFPGGMSQTIFREDVESSLKASPMIALTTDGWTSRATVSFITVTAHAISDDFTLKEFVLQTHSLEESHTGFHIAAVLRSFKNGI